MFMSALWDTIFELKNRYEDLEIFLINNRIPALKYGNGKRPAVYLAGFSESEWMGSVMLIKFIGDVLSSASVNGEMEGVRIKAAMEGKSIVVIPCVCPGKSTGADFDLRKKVFLPIAKYLKKSGAKTVYIIKADGNKISYSDSFDTDSDRSETICRVLCACSGLEADYGSDTSEESRFKNGIAEVIKIPAFLIGTDLRKISDLKFLYKKYRETFMITALI